MLQQGDFCLAINTYTEALNANEGAQWCIPLLTCPGK